MNPYKINEPTAISFSGGRTSALMLYKTLERENNDGDYCPDNCTWATRAEQNRNKR